MYCLCEGMHTQSDVICITGRYNFQEWAFRSGIGQFRPVRSNSFKSSAPLPMETLNPRGA
jgi:hypothetical protein